MLWAILAVLAALTYAFINVIDKYAVSFEFKDPVYATFIYSSIASLFLFCYFLVGGVLIETYLIFLILISTLIVIGAVYFYYSFLIRGDVSSFVPFLSMSLIFVAILAYFILGERLSIYKYLGIFIIFLGALLISKNFKFWKGKSRRGFIILFLFVTFFFAVDSIIVKYVTSMISLLQFLFWIGAFNFIISLVIIIFHHPHIIKKAKRASIHLVFSNLLTIFAMVLVIIAISGGSVSLVSALVRLKDIFLFFIAFLLTKRKLLNERFGNDDFIRKLVSIILISIGAVVILF